MKRILGLGSLIVTMVMLFSGCGGSSDNGDPTIKAITAFMFDSPAVEGTVSEVTHSIEITLPAGMPLTALIPTITYEGASLSPESGVAQNFEDPVIYTVTAEDGTKQDYSVTVTVTASPVLSNARTIKTFIINSPVAVGIVSAATHSIAVTVPAGTVLTALIPTITYSGARISPKSGVAQNFSGPVIYTVTAEDGTKRQYVVTVTVAAIMKVSFDAVGTNYYVVPAGIHAINVKMWGGRRSTVRGW